MEVTFIFLNVDFIKKLGVNKLSGVPNVIREIGWLLPQNQAKLLVLSQCSMDLSALSGLANFIMLL